MASSGNQATLEDGHGCTPSTTTAAINVTAAPPYTTAR